MSALDIILLILAAVMAVAVAVLAMRAWRLSAEQRNIRRIAQQPGKPLVDSVAEMSQHAQDGARVPVLQAFCDNLLASCPVPVILLDSSLTIIDLSHRAESELDQPRRRRGLLETMESNELAGLCRRALDSMKRTEEVVRLYAQGRRPYRATAIPFSAGGDDYVVLFLENIAAALDFGELRSQFAATVSHELRTPVAGIKAMVETLQDPDIGAEERERFLSRIDQETNRLAQLIDEILFLSSLESGSASLEGTAVLKEAVDSVVEKLQPQARRFETRITTDVPDTLSVSLPERMVFTIVSNVVENAIKYAGRGSHVQISAERAEEGIRLSIKDDGIGIDAEHLPHIYERFYRVDKSRSRRLGGTGLGLSIVKHIVESAGGRVAARSREGFGTEIIMTLPAA